MVLVLGSSKHRMSHLSLIMQGHGVVFHVQQVAIWLSLGRGGCY